MLQRDRSSAEGMAGTVHRLSPRVAWHFPRHAVHWGPGGHGCVWTQTCQLGKARGPGGDPGGQDHGSPDPRATLLTPGVPGSQVALLLPMAMGGAWLPEKEPPAQGLRGLGAQGQVMPGTGSGRARIRLDRAPARALRPWAWLVGRVCWLLGCSPARAQVAWFAAPSAPASACGAGPDPKSTGTQDLRVGPRLETGSLKM